MNVDSGLFANNPGRREPCRDCVVTAITVNVLLFVGIFSRMIPSQAVMSAISIKASAARSARSVPRCSSSPAASARCSRPRSSRSNRTVRFERIGYVVVTTTIITLVYFV
jgi:hypothetical protein